MTRRVVVIAVALPALFACGYSNPYPDSGPVAGAATAIPTPSPSPDNFNAGAGLKMDKRPDGLQIIDLQVGTGATAVAGQNVTVHYTGWLSNGNKFDSSRDRGQPFSFPLGQHHVIQGWDEGVAGMKVGGKRKLIIPPSLGYGAKGSPPTIPPNSELVFDVELLGVGAASPSPS